VNAVIEELESWMRVLHNEQAQRAHLRDAHSV
jgi:hypothetical protein